MADNKKLEEIKEVSNEIKETTGSGVEIYDEVEENEEKAGKPAKKKFKLKKKHVIIGVVALIVLFFIVKTVFGGKNQVMPVQTTEVAKSDIENILSISGTVQSAETKTYFSEVAAPVDEVNVKVGDKVKSGDVIFTYDADSLDLAEKNAQLAITQAKGSYSSLYSGTGAADRKYAEGMTPDQINARLDAITAEINALNNKITDKTSRMNQTLTDLQKTALDINQNGIADGSAESYLDGNDGYITRRENDNNNSDISESNKQMSLAVQESIADVQYALANDPEIQGWKRQITSLQEEQSHLQSAKAATINGGQAQASKAQYESTQLTQEDNISKIQEAKEGIKAEFNGVVTEVAVVEGATLAAGTKTVTMANLDNVEITIQVSKSDLPKISVGQKVDITINGKAYAGEVSKISGAATKNNNGVAVVDTIIKVTNPDSDIILGVEANNKIHAEKAENTIVLPYEYILTDETGDYVYVVDNGVVARRDVELGITTSTDAQVIAGLNEGDEIITSDTSLLTEGMAVAVVNM